MTLGPLIKWPLISEILPQFGGGGSLDYFMDKYWFVRPRISDLAMLSTTWAYSRAFVKINLVMYGIGESALVIQGKNGNAWIYLSLCAYHHFEPHLEKLELYIIHRDASYNYRYLRIRDADCFFYRIHV